MKNYAAPFFFKNIIPAKVPPGQSHVDAALQKISHVTGNEMVISFLGDAGNRRTEQYQELKKYTLQTGVLTQCIDCDTQSRAYEKKVGKDAPNIQFNITRQIINKLGELCWWSNIISAAPSLANKCIMVIGIDVYHDKKTFDKGKERYRQRRSIGAFVASIVLPNGVYRTSCGINVHTAREELIGGPRKERQPMQASQIPSNPAPDEVLETPSATENDALEKFIRRACTEHNCKPDHIIVYRDGVAHSQLEAVKRFEVSQVKKAVPSASLCYTVVQKRIHTRFLIDLGNGNYGNPPPGTVISKDLKLSGEPYTNFHLIPTTCNLSTVKPVHYIIISNDGLPMDQLQQLTYAFCHLYPNWTNSIKLPFVTQAAHKMAYLIGDLKIDNPNLHQNLYRSYFYL